MTQCRSNSEIQQNILEPVSDHIFVDGNHNKELVNGLNALRTQGIFCDVTLKVHSEHTGVAAHRQVLAALSPHFRALYASEETVVVKETILQDLTPTILECIVDYVYTGTAKLTTENARPIFEASVLLQLENLRNASTRFLKKCITSQNCLELLLFAEKHRCRELSEKAREQVGANFADVVKDSQFLRIGAKDLKEIISGDFLSVKSENEVYQGVKKWIEHDYKQRLQYVPILMSQIRFRFMPREFLTGDHAGESIMSASPLIRDFVHEALKFEILPPEEQKKVPTARVEVRWCTQSIDVISLVGGVCLEKGNYGSSYWAFDPVNGVWYTTSPLTSTRQNFGLIHWDDGKIYVFGGSPGEEFDQFLAKVEVYDPKLDRWTCAERTMKEARSRFDAVVVEETVYFVGGMCNDSHRNTLEIYRRSLKEKKRGDSLCPAQLSAPMQPRYDHCTVVLNGKIYFIGGCSRGHVVLKTVECYNPVNNTWSNVAPLLVARSGACAVVLNNRIIVIGGSSMNNKPQNTCETYDANKNQWEYIAFMNERRDRCSASCFKQKVYVFGGSYGRVIHNSVECYSAKTNKWKVVSHLPTSKYGFKCVTSVVNRSRVQEVCFEQV